MIEESSVLEHPKPVQQYREPTHTLAERAKSLRPLLEKYAPIHDERGELSEEVLTALEGMGAFRMAAPIRWGGMGASATVMAEVARQLSRGCTSTAWVVSIYNSTAWTASTTNDELQRLIFRNGIPRICGSQNGRGTMTTKDGVTRISGQWGYASGSRHAHYVLLPCFNESGALMLTFVPMSSLRVERTWNVVGMKGTSSDTIVAKDVIVPSDHISRGVGVTGKQEEDSQLPREPSDYWIAFPFLRAKALGVLIGCVEGLLDAVLSTKDKPYIYTTLTRRADSSKFQADIGRVASAIQVSSLIMAASTKLVDEAAAAGRPLDTSERVLLRGQCATAIDLLDDAANTLMSTAGSSAFALTNSAQRYWRDYETASRHIIFSPSISYESYGEYILDNRIDLVPNDFL